MREFHMAERVYEDLNEIWAYVVGDSSIATADRLIDEITSHFRNIEASPITGTVRPDIAEILAAFPSAVISFCSRSLTH